MERKNERIIIRLLTACLIFLGLTLGMGIMLVWIMSDPQLITYSSQPNTQNQKDMVQMESSYASPGPVEVVDGIDISTGFIAEGDYHIVRTTCTACHSSKLVLQNRATREGWKEMIVWMQETQKLWDLGEQEEKIIEYLATYYGPVNKGRRIPIKVESWYEINGY